MKKTSLIIILLLISFLSTKAQSEDTVRKETLDSALFRVLYKLEEQALKDSKPFIVTDTMALDIGNTWSKYYSYYREIKDSVDLYSRINNAYPLLWRKFGEDDEALQAKLESKQEMQDKLDERQYGEPSIIYKNRQKDEIMTIDNGPFQNNHYTVLRFTESISPQNWTIESDTLTVLNYLCQKATTSFRGRTYIVWFTMDIPLNEGPWKLYGLPGMILKAEDSEGLFRFHAIGIEKIQNVPIEVFQDKWSVWHVYQRRRMIFKRKFVDGNLRQWHALRKQRFKTISIAYVESDAIYYYKTKNPVEYIEMEIEE